MAIATACGTDHEVQPPQFKIATEFQQNYELFVQECAKRNIEFKAENLLLEVLPEGYKNEDGSYPNSISKVEHNQRIAQVAISMCQEFSVFRELTHVLLGKPYAETGEVIMNPQADPCAYWTPSGNNETLQNQYFDQLFAK